MKSKINFPGVCTMLLCLCFSKNMVAQQIQAPSPDHSQAVSHNGQPPNIYTYRVFEAPNKMYGYDVFKNGKGIFHQPAVIMAPNNVDAKASNNAAANQNAVRSNLPVTNTHQITADGFSKEEFAQNAALISIEKIKKRSAPALTNDEIKRVINSNSNTIIKH